MMPQYMSPVTVGRRQTSQHRCVGSPVGGSIVWFAGSERAAALKYMWWTKRRGHIIHHSIQTEQSTSVAVSLHQSSPLSHCVYVYVRVFVCQLNSDLRYYIHLLNDSGHKTGTNSLSTLSDVESLVDLHRGRVNKLENHLSVVTGVDGLGLVGTLGESQDGGDGRGSDVHLGSVVAAKRGGSASLLGGDDVKRSKELSVGADGTRLADDHTSLDLVSLDTSEQDTGIVTSHGGVEILLEHLNTSNDGLDGLLVVANKLDFLTLLQVSSLDSTSNDGSSARDGVNLLNGHQERLLKITVRGGDVLINGLHKGNNGVFTNVLLLALKSAQSRAHDDGGVVTIKSVLGQQISHLHVNELQNLLILNLINLVNENNQVLNTNLSSKQQMLSGLGLRTVSSSNNNDSTVHLGGTGDHVLDVIGVTGTVNVGVVSVSSLVLNVGGRNGDTSSSLLGSSVDRIVVQELGAALLGKHLGDSGGQSGLSVVNVANGSNVHVGLGSVKGSVTSGKEDLVAGNGGGHSLGGGSHTSKRFEEHFALWGV
jgi:hypothetical protein